MNRATQLFVDIDFQQHGPCLCLISYYSCILLASSHSLARSVHLATSSIMPPCTCQCMLSVAPSVPTPMLEDPNFFSWSYMAVVVICHAQQCSQCSVPDFTLLTRLPLGIQTKQCCHAFTGKLASMSFGWMSTSSSSTWFVITGRRVV